MERTRSRLSALSFRMPVRRSVDRLLPCNVNGRAEFLEANTQPKLNLPRSGTGVDDEAGGWVDAAGGRQGVWDGETEIRVVERVVEFRAEPHVEVLPDWESFLDRS